MSDLIKQITADLQQQIETFEQAFVAMPGKIDLIHDFEWGTDVSPEGLGQGRRCPADRAEADDQHPTRAAAAARSGCGALVVRTHVRDSPLRASA